MYKCFLFIADVNKSSVQGRKDLLHLAEVDIPHREGVPVAGLFVKFDEPTVFHQCYRNFCRIDINNQIFNRFHQESSFSRTMK